MHAIVISIFSLLLVSVTGCNKVGAANQSGPKPLGDKLTSDEKSAIEKQKKILDEIMVLYAKEALDRPADFTACAREMFAMNRSKKCRDKFTHYSAPEIAKQQRDDYTGHFGGVGLELSEEDGAVIISTPVAGSPSERGGLKSKDIILKVDNKEVRDVEEAVLLIRGEPGTKVILNIFRPATKQKLDFTITREIINLQVVKWRVSGINPKIGIVEIHRFDETVPVKFTEAVIDLVGKNAPNIVIDVRNNPGGLVDSVLAMLGLFAQDKDILLSTRSRHEQTIITAHKNFSLTAKLNYVKASIMLMEALGAKSLGSINTVLLINNGSASASEILAGTMKDWGYPIIGEKSYGKGVGQGTFELSDHSVLTLTTFEFLVGNHHVAIRDKGVLPTVEVKMPEKIEDKNKKEELNDHEKEQADPQLLKAIEVLEACRLPVTPSLYKCTRN